MNLSAFHIRFKASNACETAKMVENFGHGHDGHGVLIFFTLDKAGNKRNAMLRAVEAEELLIVLKAQQLHKQYSSELVWGRQDFCLPGFRWLYGRHQPQLVSTLN